MNCLHKQSSTSYLEKCINVPDSRDVLGNKWAQLSLQLNGLRSVESDVSKQLLQLPANLQMIIVPGVIHPAVYVVGSLRGITGAVAHTATVLGAYIQWLRSLIAFISYVRYY